MNAPTTDYKTYLAAFTQKQIKIFLIYLVIIVIEHVDIVWRYVEVGEGMDIYYLIFLW